MQMFTSIDINSNDLCIFRGNFFVFSAQLILNECEMHHEDRSYIVFQSYLVAFQWLSLISLAEHINFQVACSWWTDKLPQKEAKLVV